MRRFTGFRDEHRAAPDILILNGFPRDLPPAEPPAAGYPYYYCFGDSRYDLVACIAASNSMLVVNHAVAFGRLAGSDQWYLYDDYPRARVHLLGVQEVMRDLLSNKSDGRRKPYDPILLFYRKKRSIDASTTRGMLKLKSNYSNNAVQGAVCCAVLAAIGAWCVCAQDEQHSKVDNEKVALPDAIVIDSDEELLCCDSDEESLCCQEEPLLTNLGPVASCACADQQRHVP